MNIDELYSLLFPETNRIFATEYLGFLARRVPPNVADELERVAHPDLMLSKEISITDLVRPLTTSEFPTDKLFDIASVLQHAMYVYVDDICVPPNRDPFTLIYGASLYLYCLAWGGGHPRNGPFILTLNMLTSVSTSVDFETRLQLSRFLGFLLPIVRSSDIDDFAPLSSLLLTMSLILSRTIEQLSEAAKDAMGNEKIENAWAKDDDSDPAPREEAITYLKNSISEVFGGPGALRQSADRFLFALE